MFVECRDVLASFPFKFLIYIVYPGLLIDDYPEFADTRKKGTPLTLHLNLLEN